MKIFTIVIILLIGINCKNDSSEKKKENSKILSLLAYQQANANKIVDNTPTCLYTSSSGRQTNVFLSTATTTGQNIKYSPEDSGFGVTLQSYSMIRVITKANGKLTLTGNTGGGFLSVTLFSNTDPCVVNVRTNLELSTGFTSITTSSSSTITFNQANTYLVLSSIAFNTDTPTISVKYSD